ncbi:MAG: ATP-binding protein, partial [Actinomycetota bacterium]|nr:ATP-binding protein [Actinomycetota bacterium]
EVGRLGTTFNEMTASLLGLTGDLREAAAEEQRLRTRIETIMASMADGLVAVGGDGKVLAFNPEAERLTGVRAEEAIGGDVEEVLVTSTGDEDRSSLILADLQEGVPLEVLLVRPDDEKMPIAITTAFLRDDDEVVGAVAVLRDITREREVERMKSEFLSNISHELRTPLTPIRGYAEILGGPDVPPEKAAQFARGIVDSTARLERIVELLLDFSALEAGRLQPRNRPVPIDQVIGALAEKWSGRSSRHEVVAEVEGALPEVIGDERLLRRSLEEVLDNAIKFSPDGGTIRLAVKAGENGPLLHDRRDDRGLFRSGIELTVADEGIGMAAEDLPKIFSDFHQLDGSATRSYGGLGLGLAFVQRIIEAHSGSVEVESVLDRGTVVKILIPARRRDGER